MCTKCTEKWLKYIIGWFYVTKNKMFSHFIQKKKTDNFNIVNKFCMTRRIQPKIAL